MATPKPRAITFTLYDLPHDLKRRDLIKTLARAMRKYVQDGYGDDEDRAISISLDDLEDEYDHEGSGDDEKME